MLDALLFAKTPALLKKVYPACIWDLDAEEKTIYLTFDDGPQREITPFVLDTLAKWKAKATFFCIGKNIEAEPDLFQRILSDGHQVGNHTQNHANGWKTDNEIYFQDIAQCDTVLQQQVSTDFQDKKLFRPPYGKLTPAQYQTLHSMYKIVMWDVLSFDFDQTISKERVLSSVINNASSGSIILMHDSLKAKSKVEYALPKILEHFSAKGFRFAAL